MAQTPEALRPPGRSGRVGRAITSLCGGALALNLLFVLGLILLLAYEGGAHFWQRDLALLALEDGRRILGEIHETRPARDPDGRTDAAVRELRVRTGNRDPELGGQDFLWIPEASIREAARPGEAVLLERWTWGSFFGYVTGLRRGGEVLAEGPEVLTNLDALVARKHAERREIVRFEKGPLGDLDRRLERLRLERRRLAREEPDPARRAARDRELELAAQEISARHGSLSEELRSRRAALDLEEVRLETADGRSKWMPVSAIVRVVRPNVLDGFGKLGLYCVRLWGFVSEDPRESNTEGGIFPAIFGTVLMVFLMSLLAVPLGVLAAIYLREYARAGALTRLVRIAVGNLAGTPSIVFGVLGLGFFVYVVGRSIDEVFYPDHTAPVFGTGGILWAALTLAILTVPVVIVATEEGLAAVPRVVREGSLALGATKWETLRRVVLPASSPAILTGMILAMGRAAGEVAPLMIVGLVKMAPDLPIDGQFPFIHLERKFMHIGLHIYDVGFQSPNVEAAKPLVSATALLLLLVVTLMNLAAIRIRNHLRARYATSGL